MARRLQAWSPDTCGCRNLYMVFEDDGSWHMASVVEALQVHQERYDAYLAGLAALGLSLNDVQNHSAKWLALVEEAERNQRLFDVPMPVWLKSGVSLPAQAPYQICRTHFDMGYKEDDDDTPESEARRGAILAECQTKNHAIVGVMDALAPVGATEEERQAIAGKVTWSFDAPDANNERPVRIEIDHPDATVKKAAIESAIAARTGGKVVVGPRQVVVG